MAGAILALAARAVSITHQHGQPAAGRGAIPGGRVRAVCWADCSLACSPGPLAVMDKRPGATWHGVVRNWSLVFIGNFAGAFTVYVRWPSSSPTDFTEAPNAIGQRIGTIGEGRTLGYAAHGIAGMLTLFIRAV